MEYSDAGLVQDSKADETTEASPEADCTDIETASDHPVDTSEDTAVADQLSECFDSSKAETVQIQDVGPEPCSCKEMDYKWTMYWTVPPAPDSGYAEFSHVFAECPEDAEVSPLSDPAGAIYCVCEDGATPLAPSKSPEDGWGCWAKPWQIAGKPSGADCKFVFWCRGMFCEDTKKPC